MKYEINKNNIKVFRDDSTTIYNTSKQKQGCVTIGLYYNLSDNKIVRIRDAKIVEILY